MHVISEIFLHVGFHKTGSTSIQDTLFSKKNLVFLKNNYYLYPKHWPRNHSIPLYSNFCDNPEIYHSNIKKGYSIEEIKKINEEYLLNLEKEIKKNICSKLIISGEDISVLAIDNLLNLKNYFLSTCGKQVKFNIIIFVRNPISSTVSVIQELVKNGSTEQTASEIAMSDSSDMFQKKIEKFTEVFGSESVKIYSFEEAIKHKFGPVGYFIDLLNVNDNEISRFHYLKSNVGLSMFTVKFLSYVNMKIPTIIDSKQYLKEKHGKEISKIESRAVHFIGLKQLMNLHGPKYDISYADKKKIIENSQHDVNWLRENYAINYSCPRFSKNQNDFEITEEIIHELKNTFQNLTYPLKLSLIEFLHLYCDSVNDEKNKISIINLLHELDNLGIINNIESKILQIGLKIISKILPSSATDKIIVFYLNKIRQAR